MGLNLSENAPIGLDLQVNERLEHVDYLGVLRST